MRGMAWVAGAAVTVSACLSLDGYSGGPVTDAGAPEAGSVQDAAASSPVDATADAADAATCGLSGPTDQLLAYFPFDETAGNTSADCSSNHFTGTFIQASTDDGSRVPGHDGNAIHVRASEKTGCVDIGLAKPMQKLPFSIATWVKVDVYPDTSASAYIIGQSINAMSGGWRLGIVGDTSSPDAGFIAFLQGQPDGSFAQDQQPWPTDNAWHHVVSEVEANRITLYVDGMPAGAPLAPALPVSFRDVSMRIGCREDNENYFSGAIDELRFYGRLLTLDEIQALAAQ